MEFNLSGSNYRKSESGQRVFIEYLGEDKVSWPETPKDEKWYKTPKKKYGIGDINSYGEMKVSETGTSKDWVYVGRKGKNHPKVEHLFK